MSENPQTPSQTFFNNLYDKLGSNFFLGCFVIALGAVGYLYFDLQKCQNGSMDLEQKNSHERAADKQEFIDYLIGIHKEVQEVKTEAETEADKTEAQKAQIFKLKKDLKWKK